MRRIPWLTRAVESRVAIAAEASDRATARRLDTLTQELCGRVTAAEAGLAAAVEATAEAAVEARLETAVEAALKARLETAVAAAIEARLETAVETAVRVRLQQPEQQLRQVTAKANDAHRLAVESARAVERLLQAELELWQAVDVSHSNRDVSAAP